MSKIFYSILKKTNIGVAMFVAIALSFGTVAYVYASATSNFTLTINPGTLSTDIVNGSYVSVGSPSVAFSAVSATFACQTPGSTGTFGTGTQQIYVANPDAADSGWTLSLAASAPTAMWDSAGTDLDFNDSSGSGCTDGVDTDTIRGQMTVNPAGATLANGQCVGGCNTSNVTLGSSAAYVEDSTDSITIATAAASASDVADYTIQGVAVSQTIPGSQPAAADYDINMTLSVVAS